MKLLFDKSNIVNVDTLLKYGRYVWFMNRFELKFLRTTKFLTWLGKNHNDNINTKRQWTINWNKIKNIYFNSKKLEKI
jgi:hypothetical protein